MELTFVSRAGDRGKAHRHTPARTKISIAATSSVSEFDFIAAAGMSKDKDLAR